MSRELRFQRMAAALQRELLAEPEAEREAALARALTLVYDRAFDAGVNAVIAEIRTIRSSTSVGVSIH